LFGAEYLAPNSVSPYALRPSAERYATGGHVRDKRGFLCSQARNVKRARLDAIDFGYHAAQCWARFHNSISSLAQSAHILYVACADRLLGLWVPVSKYRSPGLT
jgi:hypothetical protein